MSTQTFFIPFLLPSLNDMLSSARASKGKWQAYDQRKHVIERNIGLVLKKAKVQAVVEPVEIAYTWREKEARRDPDNVACGAKYIHDTLVATGILGGDSVRYIRGLHHDYCINSRAPGVHVTIRTVGAKDNAEHEPV